LDWNSSPVSPTIAAAATDRACTSSPTLVRSVNTGASHNCRIGRTGGRLLGNPRICVSQAPAHNPPTRKVMPGAAASIPITADLVGAGAVSNWSTRSAASMNDVDTPPGATHDHRIGKDPHTPSAGLTPYRLDAPFAWVSRQSPGYLSAAPVGVPLGISEVTRPAAFRDVGCQVHG
jgi:hypothetical protein